MPTSLAAHDATDPLRLLRPLAAALDGTGPALLPLPTGPDEVRSALLTTLDPGRPLERDDVALVVPTSGSTGPPKGVLLTAPAVLASVRATHARLAGPGRWLLALPTTHVAGLMVLARSLQAGTTPVVVETSGGFRAESFAAALAAARALPGDRPLYASLVPTQLRRLLDAGVDLRALAAVLLGGAAAPVDIVERAADRGVRVVRTYGMSETCGGCVYDGVPLDGVTVDVAPDGRVLVAGPVLFSGYRLRPDVTAAALDDEGRLLTADLGRIGADGRLHVLGRADDVVVTGGVNVPVAGVEAVLAAHPAVRDVVVVGVDDPEWGQRLVAVVRPCEAAPALADLRAFAAAHLEPAALPRALVVLAELPLLASGKPDRTAVRTLVVARTADPRAPDPGAR